MITLAAASGTAMRARTLLCLIGLALPALAFAAPQFADYPAPPGYAGPSAKPRLLDANSRKFASVLREAAHRPPDFAGRHVLASWGCGASCVMSAAIDAKTGAVAWLPFTVCCWPADVQEPLEHRLDSRLLVVHGSRNEQGGGTHYYLFDGRRFKPVGGE